MNQSDSWDNMSRKSIAHHKDFMGVEVNELVSLHSIIFNMEDYPAIALLLKENKIAEINTFEVNTSQKFREYLDIVRFTDESGKKYLATVYDSDAMEQDPEVLDIFICN